MTQLYDDGACVYFYLVVSLKGVADPLRVYSELEKDARRSILHHGGSLSHHHGVGKLRTDFVQEVNSSGFNSWLQQLKKGVDSTNVFGVRNGVFGMDLPDTDLLMTGHDPGRASCGKLPSQGGSAQNELPVAEKKEAKESTSIFVRPNTSDSQVLMDRSDCSSDSWEAAFLD